MNLVTGVPPFFYDTVETVRERLANKQPLVDFDRYECENMSESAKLLVKQILKFWVMEQMLGDNIMNHPFISRNEDAENNQKVKAKATELRIFSNPLIDNLKYFWKYSELSLLVRSYICAWMLLKEYHQNVLYIFRILDKFNRGKLTDHDICEGLSLHISFSKKVTIEEIKFA